MLYKINKRPLPSALLMLLLMGVLLVVGAIFIYTDARDRYVASAEHELQIINQNQLQNVLDWHQKRFADAMSISADPFLGQAVHDLYQPEHDSFNRGLISSLQARLRTIIEIDGYDRAYLLDTNGNILLTGSQFPSSPLPEAERTGLQQALASGQVVFLEPHNDGIFFYPFISLIAPLYQDDTAVGAIWLTMDVRNTLYPLLENRQLYASNVKTLLVASKDHSFVTLDPIDGLVTLEPSSESSAQTGQYDLALQAIAGTRGVFYSTAANGNTLMAYASSVPGSMWSLISVLDLSNALSKQFFDMAYFALPIGAGLLVIWLFLAHRQHQALLRERQLKLSLQQQVRHDHLTNLDNRLAMEERLFTDWSRCMQQQQSLSVLIADVDRFKEFNDHYGHLQGDLCLQKVSSVLKKCAPQPTDMVARFGGEEFIVLLPATSLTQALKIAEQMRQSVFDLNIEHSQTSHQRVSISIGVASSENTTSGRRTSFAAARKALLQGADEALYRAKKAGRNRVCK